jgi:hypothetical protein
MDSNGIPNELQDYLMTLHSGQWFGFDNKEPTYQNLVILNSQYSKPTEQECIEGLENLKLEYSLKNLRKKRNSLLSQTDYLALSDQTMSAEMTTYRQALRDITNGLTTVADVEAVVFPEKPEASL